jgi:hypothetical protein
MSPVSRGRKSSKSTKSSKSSKSKKNKNKKRSGAAHRPADLWGAIPRPGWFDAATATVLAAAAELPSLPGPPELEDRVAQLIGRQLHQVINSDQPVRFEWWFDELVAAATTEVHENPTDPGPWWLLNGLASIATPPVASGVTAALKKLHARIEQASPPTWLDQMSQISATGDVWQMRDAYGARIAIITGFRYPVADIESVYLFDFDVCGLVRLADAGVYPDLTAAAEAWRGLVGLTAQDAKPEPVADPDALACLAYWETGEMHVMGTETRAVMDNWLRARRRADDLVAALEQRGILLPPSKPLFDDIDVDPAVDAFTKWYTARHDHEPDGEVVGALAYQWLEGAMPGTENLASPHRVTDQLNLISDWHPDDPVTIGARQLMPEWVRFHGEQAGLADELIGRAVAVAAGGERATTDCPAADQALRAIPPY